MMNHDKVITVTPLGGTIKVGSLKANGKEFKSQGQFAFTEDQSKRVVDSYIHHHNLEGLGLSLYGNKLILKRAYELNCGWETFGAQGLDELVDELNELITKRVKAFEEYWNTPNPDDK